MLKHSVFAAAGLGLFLAAAPAQAQDIAEGERLFKRCVACHALEEGKHKVGPSLYQIVGREGNVAGYSYSKINEAAHAAGLAWTEENIVAYLEDPQAYLVKYLTDAGKPELAEGRTKMTFKLRNEEDRKNVVAYLKSLQ